jgi:hypothetical protein
MGPDTEIIAGYEVYTPQAAADYQESLTANKAHLPHPLG